MSTSDKFFGDLFGKHNKGKSNDEPECGDCDEYHGAERKWRMQYKGKVPDNWNIWYNIANYVTAKKGKNIKPIYLEAALAHPHWGVVKAAASHHRLTHEQLSRVLDGDCVPWFAKEKIIEAQAEFGVDVSSFTHYIEKKGQPSVAKKIELPFDGKNVNIHDTIFERVSLDYMAGTAEITFPTLRKSVSVGWSADFMDPTEVNFDIYPGFDATSKSIRLVQLYHKEIINFLLKKAWDKRQKLVENKESNAE